MAIYSRLFCVCPRVRKGKGKLFASTAWRLRLLTLGTLYRQVIVDPKQEVVRIRRRYFWLFARNRRIPFDSVKAVIYGYQDWADTSWSWGRNTADLYTVGLRLHGGKELHLFYFYGEGEFVNEGPFPDWLYWDDYLFGAAGTQQRESHAFVELLGKMIGVPVEPPSF